MHIARVVTDVSAGAHTLRYYLNGERVFINRAKGLVRINRGVFEVQGDTELFKLVEAIGLSDSGSIKLDPANTNITQFLKLTKCLP